MSESAALPYPYEIKELRPEERAEVFKYFGESIIDDFIRVGPKNYWFAIGIKDMLPKIYNMPLRPDDTWVLSFPRSGTTLTQELVWLVANGFNFDKAKAIPLVERFPFLEFSMLFDGEKAVRLLKESGADEKTMHEVFNSFEVVSSLPSPRHIKSHLPLSLLPPTLLDTCRVVYVARDPRDVAVSYYHHYKFFKALGYTGDLKEYWKLFIEDKLDDAPFFAKIKEVWEKKNHPNLLFLFYEDLLKDMPSCVRRVADFLGKTVTEEQVARTCDHLAFDNFKKNNAVNYEFAKERGDFVEKHLSFIRKGIIDDFIRVGPKNYWFPIGIKDLLPKIYNMPLRPDDTWVMSFPKSGTTLTQELVWLVANGFDFDKAKAIRVVRRFPFLERSMYFEGEKAVRLVKESGADEKTLHSLVNSFEVVSTLPSPRHIKSHLPLSLLPPTLLDTCRVVYVARDPRDVAVSYYHHYKFFKYMGYTGDLKEYWKLFIEDKLDYAPFFAHIKEGWERKNHPNLLFLFYEDLLKDMPSCVRRVADFLGKTVTEEQVARTCDHLAFDNFKKNNAVNYEFMKEIRDLVEKQRSFVRKGKAGGWRECFDEEMKQEAERWIAENLRDTDLRFPSH